MNDAASGTSGGPAVTSGGRDMRVYLLISAITGVVALVNASSELIEAARDGEPMPVWQPMLTEFSSTVVLLALAPLVAQALRRWPIVAPWQPTHLIHAALTVPFSLVHVAGMVALRQAGWALMGGRYDFLGDTPGLVLFYEWRKDALTYAILIGLFWAWDRFTRPAPPPVREEGPARIEVRTGATTHFIPADEVFWIEAAGNYVEVHAARQTHLVRGTLAAFEAKLAGAGFVRAHRSRLVNQRRIRALAGADSGDFTVTFDDGRSVGGSRRYRAALAPSPVP